MMQTAAHPRLSREFVAEVLNSLGSQSSNIRRREESPSSQDFRNVTSDSRKVTPGCLFVALPGETFDGHDFIATALAQGATGVICREGTPIPSSVSPAVTVYPVKDTLLAYRELAGAWRRKFQIPVIGVAGSVGKTTTKEMLSAILSGKFRNVLKTTGSQNGFVGIPMTLLELRPEHDAAVIEIGIDEIGAMIQHLKIVSPTASVLTTIGPEHLEHLRDLPTVANEEGIALTYVAANGGSVAANMNDPWMRPLLPKLPKKALISFALQSDPGSAAIKPELLGELNEDRSELRCRGRGIDAAFPLPLPGKHNAVNLLAAIAISTSLGLNAREILEGLKTFRGADGRSELRQLPGPTPVLCDYYNANPTSTEAALDLLTELSKPKRRTRWACLADMLELGPEEARFHRELATKLLDLKVEHVLLYGPLMRALDSELRKRGFGSEHFSTLSELARALKEGARPGDAILIKGSRSMKMEAVWKELEPHANAHWKSEP